MKRSFYITTPIYYVNGQPHIGTAYTTVAADVVARYHRQQGEDVFFLTGTDEHGINNERAARARGLDPRVHVEEVAGVFQALWRTLDISHTRFIRTTEPQHRRAALELWRRLEARGDLYRGVYEGPYCPRCEAYYQEEELSGGLCPIHGQPCEYSREENFFFRLSRYQEPLAQLVRDTDFVQPAVRRNEVLGVLRQGLRDFSVTRRNVQWGIPVPGQPDEVLYVWIDALANYLSGVGFPDDLATFGRYWPADVHLVGKDIIRFHCLYWPAILLSAGLPLPRRVFAHGWLTDHGRKIGKSSGNAVAPESLAATLGVDGLRYCLLRAAPFGQDGDAAPDSLVACYNAELANNYGNLVQRATTLVARYAGGVVPAPGPSGPAERRLQDAAATLQGTVAGAFERLALDEAIEAVAGFVTAANRYAEETAPWQLARQTRGVAVPAQGEQDAGAAGRGAADGAGERLHTALCFLAEAARLASWYLWPVIPTTAAAAHRRLCGQAPDVTGGAGGAFGWLEPGARVEAAQPLFPRLRPPLPG
ncbi:MAG TPA: methionine--tRNA ligase [Chloroflexota bacterium]|nr:methionine--tRNA ligase [Chloroflexota bacterium]